MAAKPPSRPAPRTQVVGGHVDSLESADRVVGELAGVVEAQAQAPRSVREGVDLVVGDNRVVTGLSRRARGCNLTPTVADATFAWAFAPSGDRMAVITVIGVDQPGATLECY